MRYDAPQTTAERAGLERLVTILTTELDTQTFAHERALGSIAGFDRAVTEALR
jgi:hypothetical protein